MDRVTWLQETLRRTFAPLHLEVEDESHRHAGHRGAASGGGHFRVLIVSDAFRGQDRVNRQRAVYAALGDSLRSEVHALAMRTLTAEEWQRERDGA